MENRDYYLLKEIILGLRKEYQENQKKIDELAKYIEITDKSVKGLEMFVRRQDNNYYLIIGLQQKQNLIKKLLEKIDYAINNKEAMTKVLIDYVSINRKNYFTCEDKNKIEIKNPNDFYAETDNLLLNSFNTNLKNQYYEVLGEDMNVKVNHSGVYSITSSSRSIAPDTGVDYHAANDVLTVNRYYNTSSSDAIYKILDSRIPKELLNLPIRTMIENNPDSSLPIVFDGLNASRDEQVFAFDKTDDSMILRRVK